MKFNSRKSYIFYPDINGNLDLPETERLSVEIIRPTAEDCGSISYVEVSNVKDAQSYRYKFDAKTILNRCIGEIKNLEVESAEESGKTKLVKSGKELAKESFYGMTSLVDVICTEVCRDIMTDAQKKIS